MKISLPVKWNKHLFVSCFVVLAFACKPSSFSASSATYGIEKGDEYFSIAVLPDTQYYTGEKNGGTMQMFRDQIQWIRDNRDKENIKYVVHLGDITDKNTLPEWEHAKTELYKLEEDNIAYGLTVGNHDETPGNAPAKGDPNTYFTKYFGRSHFKNKPWFGGAMGQNENTDNHFDLFTANGEKYLALYFVYNEPNKNTHEPEYEKQVMHWADSVITKHADRKVMLVAHSMLNRIPGSETETKEGKGNNNIPATHTQQGRVIYAMAKHHPNVFLLLGGHIAGEGFRRDEFNGNIIKTYLADYQQRQNPPYRGREDRNGGNGLMRLMKFNKTQQTIVTTTFAPHANGQIIREEDGDSQFIEPMYR